MTIGSVPICASCSRFSPALSDWFEEEETGGPTCAAFPDGIPDPILYGEVDHREPYPGDRGLRWLPSEEPGAQAMLELFEELRNRDR